jgi:hypothetical protein
MDYNNLVHDALKDNIDNANACVKFDNGSTDDFTSLTFVQVCASVTQIQHALDDNNVPDGLFGLCFDLNKSDLVYIIPCIIAISTRPNCAFTVLDSFVDSLDQQQHIINIGTR